MTWDSQERGDNGECMHRLHLAEVPAGRGSGLSNAEAWVPGPRLPRRRWQEGVVGDTDCRGAAVELPWIGAESAQNEWSGSIHRC